MIARLLARARLQENPDTDFPAVRVELQAAVMTVLLVAANLVQHQVASFALWRDLTCVAAIQLRRVTNCR